MVETSSACGLCGHEQQAPPQGRRAGQELTLMPPGLRRLPADTDEEFQAALERLLEFRSQRPLQSQQELWATVRDLVHQWYSG